MEKVGSGPLLSVESLSYAFLRRPVLDCLSFGLKEGEIVGLLGCNGAGKSTLFKLLSGLYALQEGRIFYGGKCVASAGKIVSSQLRAKMGVVFQESSVDAKLSARTNLRLLAQVYGVSRDEVATRTDIALEKAGLIGRANDKVKTYSGGMRRRLELARALLAEPFLLLLDEPTTGLDLSAFAAWWNFLRTECAGKRTVFLVTHRAEEAEYCDRLLILHQGKIMAEGSPSQIRARVSGDVIEVHFSPRVSGDDIAGVLGQWRERFPDATFAQEANAVRVSALAGPLLVPRLMEGVGENQISAVHLRKPSLADAFNHMTGALLEVTKELP